MFSSSCWGTTENNWNTEPVPLMRGRDMTEMRKSGSSWLQQCRRQHITPVQSNGLLIRDVIRQKMLGEHF